MTQAALARALPGVVEASAVSRWERGKVRPRDETLEKIAEILSVDFAYFVAPEPETKSTPPLMDQFDGSALERIESKLDAILVRLTAVEAAYDATSADVSHLATEVLELSLDQREREAEEQDAGRPSGAGGVRGGRSETSGRRARVR